MREIITLACESCKQRNYSTVKNRRPDTPKLSLKKHCPFCNRHTIHKETK